MKFDISNASQGYQRTVRRWSLALLVVCAVCFAGAVVLGVEYSLHGAWSTAELAAVSGLVVVAIAFGAVSRAVGPQAESLEVDSEGLRMQYRNGRRKELSWSENGLHFQIGMKVHSPASGSRGEPRRELYVGPNFRAELTAEATSAILEEARRHSLVVEEKPGKVTGWTSVEIYRGLWAPLRSRALIAALHRPRAPITKVARPPLFLADVAVKLSGLRSESACQEPRPADQRTGLRAP
jgi:hypothetical protein